MTIWLTTPPATGGGSDRQLAPIKVDCASGSETAPCRSTAKYLLMTPAKETVGGFPGRGISPRAACSLSGTALTSADPEAFPRSRANAITWGSA